MVGLNKFTEKERRKARRSFQRNHLAKDLYTSKYKQQIIPDRKRKDKYFYDEDIDE